MNFFRLQTDAAEQTPPTAGDPFTAATLPSAVRRLSSAVFCAPIFIKKRQNIDESSKK